MVMVNSKPIKFTAKINRGTIQIPPEYLDNFTEALEVKVIIKFNDSDQADDLVEDDHHEEISEQDWLHSASVNPAFDFLNDPDEDIYTLADGKPFHD
jgi:hypothetical protein